MRKFCFIICLVFNLIPIYGQLPTQEEVKWNMSRVADWQIAHLDKKKFGALNWVNATFYLGLSRWAFLTEQVDSDSSYENWLVKLGYENGWKTGPRLYHADDICIGQTYLQLYNHYGNKSMLIPTLTHAKQVIANPPKGSFDLNYSNPQSLNHWTWCDALFMAPNVYLGLSHVTGDSKYIRYMNKEYRLTYKNLYDKKEHLFYRDRRYIGQKESNGAKVFWARGNGWVLGGLVEMLKNMDKGDKYYPFYKNLFIEMCSRIATLQCKDGFWRASLLDPESYPSPETSGTGFFVYALAYGIKSGLLPKDQYLPIVLNGWKALISVVEDNGRLDYVQPVGADPKKVTRNMTEAYGPGAFLLAGSEIYRLADSTRLFHLTNISAAEVKRISQMLLVHPGGIGLNYKNRIFWDKIKMTSSGIALLHRVEEKFQKGFPPFVDSLYLDLNKSNYRLPGEIMMNKRYEYLFDLTIAECMENNGKYLPEIKRAILGLCMQKSWSIPAHDRDLQNYNGTKYSVDLVTATAGNGIAQCLDMLGDKIPFELMTLARCAFRQKIFLPMFRCVEAGQPFWWLTMTNNWNSVCLAGVTGIALSILPDRAERAYYVAQAEKYQGYGMKGYEDDGYCSEGAGYYNYGFGAYILLREEVCRATSGKIDFFQVPKFVRIARYADAIQIQDGLVPLYSDCHPGLQINPFIPVYCKEALGMAKGMKKILKVPSGGNFSLQLLAMFPDSAWKVKLTPDIREAIAESHQNPKSSYYTKSGIWIGRPGRNTTCQMAVSAKSGNNAENHNHDDIGSYAVVLGNCMMLGDQGGPESYPGDYFTASADQKYKIKNSYGHPVPVVNGKLQQTGSKAQGIVLQHRFTDRSDLFQLDLRSAYPVNGLDSLNRTFIYDRHGKGSLTILDKFQAHHALTFGTALTTRAHWKQLNPHVLLFSLNRCQLRVRVLSSGPFTITTETIQENCIPYTRIGINLKKSAQNGYVKLLIAP